MSRLAKIFTPKQGQYWRLSTCTCVCTAGWPPAEPDMQEYFRVSPPSIHQMVLTLEWAGFIRRQQSTPRSIETAR